MLSLPFAFTGVFLGLLATGTPISMMSLVGMIMLIGIVVKNGIVLVDYINLNRERGLAVIPAVLDAGRSRLRPVLMTSLTTILGMLPMAMGTGEGAEMWRPMGIAVIGGLTISTIMTLIYTPVMFCVFGGNGIKRRRKSNKAKRELEAYWNEHKNDEQLISAKK
jgi:HAE1 family hydrophobic/amphiphilic exporter-1